MIDSYATSVRSGAGLRVINRVYSDQIIEKDIDLYELPAGCGIEVVLGH